MAICHSCAVGVHPHDRHTGRVPGSTPGADGGCPNVVPATLRGAQPIPCGCTAVVATVPPGRCPTCGRVDR